MSLRRELLLLMLTLVATPSISSREKLFNSLLFSVRRKFEYINYCKKYSFMEQINQVPLAFPARERVTKRKGILYYVKQFLNPDKLKITISLIIGITYSMFFWYVVSHGYCKGIVDGYVCLILLFLVANYFLSLSMILPDYMKLIVIFLGAGVTIYVYSCIIVLIYRFLKGK
jgi:hypothetical protein